VDPQIKFEYEQPSSLGTVGSPFGRPADQIQASISSEQLDVNNSSRPRTQGGLITRLRPKLQETQKISRNTVRTKRQLFVTSVEGSLHEESAPQSSVDEDVTDGIFNIVSEGSIKTRDSYSRGLAKRQHLMNKAIFGNALLGEQTPRKVISVSKPQTRHPKCQFARAFETIDLGGDRSRAEECTMLSPIAVGKRRKLKLKLTPNQVKMELSRYQLASSIVYSQRQQQLLNTYLMQRPPPLLHDSPARQRQDTRACSREAKFVHDFYPVLQSYSSQGQGKPHVE